MKFPILNFQFPKQSKSPGKLSDLNAVRGGNKKRIRGVLSYIEDSFFISNEEMRQMWKFYKQTVAPPSSAASPLPLPALSTHQ